MNWKDKESITLLFNFTTYLSRFSTIFPVQNIATKDLKMRRLVLSGEREMINKQYTLTYLSDTALIREPLASLLIPR